MRAFIRGCGRGLRVLLLLAAAFGLGCVPTGRLVTRAVAGVSVDRVGTGAPGASNVRRSLGWRAGAVVMAVDVLKGLLPVAYGRRRGLGPHVVGALGLLPVAGHILVVRGKGAATAMGATIAWDPPAFALVVPGLAFGIGRKVNAQAAVLSYLLYPTFRLLLGRSAADVGWTSVTMGMLIATRARGAAPRGMFDRRVLWERLVHDREPQGSPQL